MSGPHLNGAYYGPSIPPPSKTYHRPGHGGGCCCNPFSCCCGCLFNCICTCIFQILCTLLVIVGVVAFVLWFILRPNKVNFHVADASLTQFDLSTKNNTLYYDLALNVSIRNPNKRIGIYYDSIEARALFHGQNFSSTNLEPFYQGHKNTTDLKIVFKGQNLIMLGDKEKSDYSGEKDSGVYAIGVKLYMRIRLKFGWIKTKKIKPMIMCDLKVPFKSNGTTSSSTTFERTQCHLDW
ncbi:NDR1/HIN1-like protein 10 [Nicotiana tomentosiformis]|uniref:NDR1/HIN1-like protein 10 n=1 Tax=Nicotiana tomentosiformis TaxID=4098 RepID=UPI00051C5F90|nr:NDR1/HIN1-like protein 10 [Nicotiana tomentosiformis]